MAMLLAREKVWVVAEQVHAGVPRSWFSGTQVFFTKMYKGRKALRIGSGYLELSLVLAKDHRVEGVLEARVSGKDATRFHDAVPELRALVSKLGCTMEDDDSGDAPSSFRFGTQVSGDVLAKTLIVEGALAAWIGEDVPRSVVPKATQKDSTGDATWDVASLVYPSLPAGWEPTVYFTVTIDDPFFGPGGTASVSAVVGIPFHHFQVRASLRTTAEGSIRFDAHGRALEATLGELGYEIEQRTIAMSEWPLDVSISKTIEKKRAPSMADDCIALENALRLWLAQSAL